MKEKMQTGLRGSPAQKPVFTASNNPACQNRTSYGMTVFCVLESRTSGRGTCSIVETPIHCQSGRELRRCRRLGRDNLFPVGCDEIVADENNGDWLGSRRPACLIPIIQRMCSPTGKWYIHEPVPFSMPHDVQRTPQSRRAFSCYPPWDYSW